MADGPGERLDEFRDASGWSAYTSGEVRLEIVSEPLEARHALRLSFDFRGGRGFAVARKLFERALPASFALRFALRGEGPPNRFEVKLVDRSGRNVWWYARDAFALPHDWRELEIPSHALEFAWGPAGGGRIAELGAIEFAIAAGPGGRGALWIADLRLEDREYRARPVVSASSARPGFEAAQALETATETPWRSAAGEPSAWLCVDFGEQREYGGLWIDWLPGAGARAFAVETSCDASSWSRVFAAEQVEGERSAVCLPATRSRLLRLQLREPEGRDGFGIRALHVLPREASRTPTAFFETLARAERRGLYPRYLYGEAVHWTVIGAGDGTGTALLDEEGRIELERAGFSLEPLLFAGGRLLTWADAAIRVELARGWLPVPSSVWSVDDWTLRTTAFAAESPDAPVLQIVYRLENRGAQARPLRFFAAVRPFQVTPPWQAFEGLGGPSEIRALALRDGALHVNGRARVFALTPPSGFGASAFDQGGITAALARGHLPARTRVDDPRGAASAAWAWDLLLATGESAEIRLALPLRAEWEPRPGEPAAVLERALDAWQARLERVGLHAGARGCECIEVVRSATAHILLNRVGAALHPGPRRYARSWIRDGAAMAAALLRTGFAPEVRAYLRWYAGFLGEDGAVPCCVDSRGPDPLVEHDSHGQWIFAVAEYWHLTRERALLVELAPGALRAAAHIERLRRERLTPEYDAPARRACRGLLPESVSHEGYMAHPVHAYWDDFWALRGLADAADLAQALGEPERARTQRELRAALAESLYASIDAVRAQRGLDYVPGSVEWADCDPTATAQALCTTDALRRLPPAALARTWERYLDGFRRRRDGGMEWTSYTPYEIRNVAALVRLGWRAAAHEVLDFLLADRRPRAWNQWPEIAWRDPQSPGHLGDLPHTWIAAEYVLAVLSLFAYEDPAADALVIAAGIPAAWLEAGAEVGVDALPTRWGALSYRLRSAGPDALQLRFSAALATPPGGIVLRPPLARALQRVLVDGKRVESFDPDGITLESWPERVELAC